MDPSPDKPSPAAKKPHSDKGELTRTWLNRARSVARRSWRTLCVVKRVVIGRGASGKSTLARRLSEITGLPLIELDKVFWRPGLVKTPRDQWVVIQEKKNLANT